MSLIYKRPRSPYYYVTKTRQSTKTTNKRQAEEFARQVTSEAWRVETLGEVNKYWEDLTKHWLGTKGHKLSIADDKRMILDATKQFAGKELRKISASDVSAYASIVKERSSAATANRHLTLLRSMLRAAHDLEWLTRVPSIKLYAESRVERRWIDMATVALLIAKLPPVIALMAEFAVQTGMRQSNVFNLRWDWINLEAGVCTIPKGYTKSGKTYVVPLSTVAQGILGRIAQVNDFVFLDPATVAPYKQVKVQWLKACKDVGVVMRWHDLRHVWASNHLVNGTPDRVVQAAGGWSSPAMLQTYGHFKTEHLAKWADNVNAIIKES